MFAFKGVCEQDSDLCQSCIGWHPPSDILQRCTFETWCTLYVQYIQYVEYAQYLQYVQYVRYVQSYGISNMHRSNGMYSMYNIHNIHIYIYINIYTLYTIYSMCVCTHVLTNIQSIHNGLSNIDFSFARTDRFKPKSYFVFSELGVLATRRTDLCTRF